MNEPLVFASGMAFFITSSVALLAIEEPMLHHGHYRRWKALAAIVIGLAVYFVVRFARWAIG